MFTISNALPFLRESLYSRLLFISVLWCSSFLAFAQNNQNNERYYKKGDIDIYFNPTTILEITPTFSLGAEYFIKDNISIHTDIGYIFYALGEPLEDDFGNQNSSGLEINRRFPNFFVKPELRWYRRNETTDGYYLGLRFMFRQINYTKHQRVFDEYFYNNLTDSWTPVGNPNIHPYRTRRISIGAQFLFGWKAPFIDNTNTNFYMGLGVRYIDNQPMDKKFNPFPTNDNFISVAFLEYDKQYKFLTMDMAIGVRFGGKIKRRRP